MNIDLLRWLRDPSSGELFTLEHATYREPDVVEEGTLRTPSGRCYPIRHGIPRFAEASTRESVESFGDQWNYFNFVQFRLHWEQHTVRNTFGTVAAFREKVIVDAGAGSGAQALWMLESGARRVILLELSHCVDGVMRRNLQASRFRNWDIVQCSIDAPPIRPQSIDLVMCHNVIQHTPSVERTACALFELVAPGGELAFNCYPKNDAGMLRWLRLNLVYTPLRAVLSRCPFPVRVGYATLLATLRLVPGLGGLLEKAGFCSTGEVLPTDRTRPTLIQRFRATQLNTFDFFGAHSYQHLKTESELRALLATLQPDAAKIHNVERYFSRPAPIGCALRVRR